MTIRSFGRALFIEWAVRLGFDSLALKLLHMRMRRRRTQIVRVVNLHATPAKYADAFRRQVEWVCKHFWLIDLQTLSNLWKSPDSVIELSERPSAVFTFDDGLESNYYVAAPILESVGARGVFFVVPQFVQCTDNGAKQFFYSRISPRAVQHEDMSHEVWKPMTPEQIADLAARGHAVGNHTFSHARLSTLTTSQLHREIVESSRIISSWTGKPVDAFGWTFSWDSMSLEAWQRACRHHSLCFAPCPGAVDVLVDTPDLIWRTNVEAHYSSHEYRFMYAGLADPYWHLRRKRLLTYLGS